MKTHYLFALGLSSYFIATSVVATSLDLLNTPSKLTPLAYKSVLMTTHKKNDSLLIAGEQGYIIDWKSDTNWQQQKSPVSVAITALTSLEDGTDIAVGHDSVILRRKAKSDEWQKVFDGYQLTELTVNNLKKQITTQEAHLKTLNDEYVIEDATFALEDLSFALEDAQRELVDGPNKPLLSISAISENELLALGAYGALLYSNNKGEHWSLVSSRIDNPDKYHLNAITLSANGNMFIVGEKGIGFKSTDHGMHWQTMQMPYQGSFFGIATDPKSNSLVAFGLQGHIAISFDSGEHWELIKNPSNSTLLTGSVSQNGIVYLAGHGGKIVHFPMNNPADIKIDKHPTGAAFSSLSITSNELILAGQFGITQWAIRNQGGDK